MARRVSFHAPNKEDLTSGQSTVVEDESEKLEVSVKGGNAEAIERRVQDAVKKEGISRRKLSTVLVQRLRQSVTAEEEILIKNLDTGERFLVLKAEEEKDIEPKKEDSKPVETPVASNRPPQTGFLTLMKQSIGLDTGRHTKAVAASMALAALVPPYGAYVGAAVTASSLLASIANARVAVRQGAVVVTGASSGIGRTLAVVLAIEGFHVFAGGRNMSALEDLSKLHPDRITPLQLEVSSDESVRQAVAKVKSFLAKNNTKLAGLVNNAGISCRGPVEIIDIDFFRKTLETNVLGVTRVTQAFMPLLREAKGRVIQMSSIAGLVSLPSYGPYSATKFAVEALSDALRIEVAKWGVHVALIEPGMVNTKFLANALSNYGSDYKNASEDRKALYPKFYANYANYDPSVEATMESGIDPEVVADYCVHALRSSAPKERYLVGKEWKKVSMLMSLPTAMRDMMLKRAIQL